LKHHAWLADVYIDFVLRGAAAEDACEIKHRQQHQQSEYNGQNGHCTAAAAISVNVLLYDSFCHRFHPPFVIISYLVALEVCNQDANAQMPGMLIGTPIMTSFGSMA
jgi:hypothetical protein